MAAGLRRIDLSFPSPIPTPQRATCMDSASYNVMPVVDRSGSIGRSH